MTDRPLVNFYRDTLGSGFRDNGHGMFEGNVLGLPDNNVFFQPAGGGPALVSRPIPGVRENFGVKNPEAYAAAMVLHEIFHSYLRDSGPDGHHGALRAAVARLTTAGAADSTTVELTADDMRSDNIELEVFEFLQRRDLIDNAEVYWNSRAAAYNIRQAAGIIPRSLGGLRRHLDDPENRADSPLARALAAPIGDRGVRIDLQSPEFAVKMAFEVLTDIDGGKIGAALGTVLGKRITDNPFLQPLVSATLSTALGTLGEFIDENIFKGKSTWDKVGETERSFSQSLVANLKSAGAGALSSFLVAELFDALDIGGPIGELGQSLASGYLSAIIQALPQLIGNTAGVSFSSVIGGVDPISIAASWVGGKLAAEIKTFDNVGGQIGSAVGAVIGAAHAAKLVAMAATTGNPYLIALAVVVVVVDILTFGFIGSLFGGTPRSGADVAWDAQEGQFEATNIYARKGGSKDAAKGLATSVANNLNAVLAATGSVLEDPSDVQTGNYGMRTKTFVYRPTSTLDKNAITARFTGDTGAADLVKHGTYLAINSMMDELMGGNIYVKRAIAATIAEFARQSAKQRRRRGGQFLAGYAARQRLGRARLCQLCRQCAADRFHDRAEPGQHLLARLAVDLRPGGRAAHRSARSD